jgi:dipeptide transport system permease protein
MATDREALIPDPAEELVGPAAPPAPLVEFWHYFRQNHGAVAGLAVVVILVFVAVFADYIAPHPPDVQ